MAVVDKTTLNSNPYKTVLSILRNTSYIRDPRKVQGDRNRKFIASYEIDTTSFSFGLYPFIVCKPAIKTQSKQSADQSTQEILWTQPLIVKTSLNGSGNSIDEKGVDDMLSITDDIDQYFESSAVRKDFKDAKLNFMDINTTSYMAETTVDGKLIFETIYEIRYRSRVVVK